MFEATVIKHSINSMGQEIVTLQLCYPRFIHSEFMTHRVFSRNAMSSRAIPVSKMIQQVRERPASPVHWGANQPGMQARQEVNDVVHAQALWLEAATQAADTAQKMVDIGLHKQVANRILEPFQWMRTIMTATDLANFFMLRCHPDADPNIEKLANLMHEAVSASFPEFLEDDEWHLPYITDSDYGDDDSSPHDLRKVSAARCARVSYLTHDGANPSPEADLALFERLAGSVPMHASPLEHVATPGDTNTGNFVGWTQYRKIWEQEYHAT